MSFEDSDRDDALEDSGKRKEQKEHFDPQKRWVSCKTVNVKELE